MSLKSLLKKEKKEQAEEFVANLKQINRDFLRFQLDHGIRAVIGNTYQKTQDYGPNLIIDLICQFNTLSWRKITEPEIQQINEQLAKEAGIVLPK